MSPPIEAPPRPRSHASKPAPLPRLANSIDRWVNAGLISREQGDAIRRAEAARVVPPALEPRRVPLVAEVLGYLGAVLAVAAGGVLLGQRWDTLAIGARISIAATGTVALWLVGWLLRDADEPAFQRFAGVAWVLSVGALAGLVAIIGVDVWKPSPEATATAAGAACFVYAAALWAWRRRVLQLAAVLATGVALTASAVSLAGAQSDVTALAVWMFGLAWFIAAWRGAFGPGPTGYVLGALPLLIAPSVGAEADWMLFLGLVSAGAMMAASVWLRETPLLFMGSIGLFVFVMSLVDRYFADSLGVPMALLLAGVLLIGIALVTGRLYRFPPGSRGRPKTG